MPAAFRRYTSADEDSGRWKDFVFRTGDIVISTRSKHGTTWMQMICALLVFQTPELPDRLEQLSPWVDWLVIPEGELFSRLEEQTHRRFVKTHTPLDGIVLDPRATYIVVARHPLDAAVSLYHQGSNLNRERLRELTGNATERSDPPPLADWLRSWIARDASPFDDLDSLPGVMWHLADAWARRDSGNVVLVHYDDLLGDLPGEMQRLAARLGISIGPERITAFAAAARFDAMKERSAELAPDAGGVLIDPARFFRCGGSGSAAEILNGGGFSAYEARAAQLVPPDLLDWLHRPSS